MPAPQSDASRCPLCSQPNGCAETWRGAPGASAPRCWCMDVAIDPLQLARIPDDRRGQACICAICAGTASKIGASLNPAPRSITCPPTTSK